MSDTRLTPSVTLVAAGKAAAPMAEAAGRILGPRLRSGIVVSHVDRPVPAGCDLIVAGHPTPTEASERAGQAALNLARRHDAALLLVLLSGGASSLMAVPADGVTLDDKRQTTAHLLRAGADIHALNTVRKHLSAIKGGQLAAACVTPSLTLTVSDVVTDDESVIASGPTVADSSTFADALEIINRFGGDRRFPARVTARFRAGAEGRLEETPKLGDPRLAEATTRVIASRHNAMDGAEATARALGYRVVRLEHPVTGEARTAAHAWFDQVVTQRGSAGRPVALISSGETTVHVTGSGTGGRNQEFALALADRVGDLSAAAVASAGTDGIDGPTDAAGAIVDSTTISRARAAGLEPPSIYLNNNNSYTFFSALGDLIRPGPTNTNVGDIQVFLLA